MAVTNITDLGLTALSYNSTGWSDYKINFISTLLLTQSVLVLAVQEHMLLKRNCNRIASAFPNYESFILPATKTTENISAGRPSGGIALIYSKSISHCVTQIICPGSSRVQAINITFNKETFVFINVYFPTDPRLENFDDTSLLQTLQDINYVLNQCQPHFKINILGDINADFGRNTRFVNIVRDYLTTNNLCDLWDLFECDFTFSQEQSRNGQSLVYYSTIDHFLGNEQFLQSVIHASVLHLGDNMSNHNPIIVKCHCNKQSNILDDDSTVSQQSKPKWDKATSEQIQAYRTQLVNSLENMVISEDAFSCSNVNCINPNHISAIDHLTSTLTSIIDDAVSRNIPASSGNHSGGQVAGWNEFVKPYQDEAKFWFSIWTSYGRPQNNEIHHMMRSSKNQYHFAVRRAKKNESIIRKEKFLEQCLNNDTNSIFKDLKKSRTMVQRPTNIDGVTGSNNIANNLKDVYSELYNSHNDKSEINEIMHRINESVLEGDISEVNKITPSLIKATINRMKSGKNDVSFDFRSDALKYGVNQLAPHISTLFKAFLTHGYLPNSLLKCSLIPIPKDPNANLCSSSNYRAIAMSALLMKLYDVAMMELVKPQEYVSQYQFGFMVKISTTFCTWSVTESINYFTNRGGPMYVCLLDLSKAFDMVKLSKLFEKLHDKVPPIHLRLLIYSYIKQECNVRWGNHESDSFNTSNGVRQGSSSSPVLFSLYIDSLFTILQDSGFGCHIDQFYYGVCAYADDIVLLSPNRFGLQQMVNMCYDYFHEHGIQISTNSDLSKSKTKCMHFNIAEQPMNISLNGLSLPWVSSYKHLGTIIHNSEDWVHDMLIKRGMFIGGFHELQQELGVQHPAVMLRLVNTYITSFYGSPLWDLNSSSSYKLWTAWNRMINTVYKLPFGTHRYILNELSTLPHLKTMLTKRFQKFQSNLSACTKPHVKHLQSLQKYDYRSSYGRNCQSFSCASLKEYFPVPDTESWRIPIIHDLLNSNISGFSNQETQDMLKYVCTT